jgi:hypothetical protein
MTRGKRKIGAMILLVLLICVPFWDWKLGAALWMCAWLVFIFQNIFPKHEWKLGDNEEQGEEEQD